MEKEYIVDSLIIVDIDPCDTFPTGNDFRKVVVEINGRKLAIWTTESNIKALEFDQQQKKNEQRR